MIRFALTKCNSYQRFLFFASIVAFASSIFFKLLFSFFCNSCLIYCDIWPTIFLNALLLVQPSRLSLWLKLLNIFSSTFLTQCRVSPLLAVFVSYLIFLIFFHHNSRVFPYSNFLLTFTPCQSQVTPDDFSAIYASPFLSYYINFSVSNKLSSVAPSSAISSPLFKSYCLVLDSIHPYMHWT